MPPPWPSRGGEKPSPGGGQPRQCGGVASPSSKLKPASVSLAEHKGKELQADHKDEELAELETELVELAELAYLAELACLAELSSPSNTRPELPSPSETRAAMGGPPSTTLLAGNGCCEARVPLPSSVAVARVRSG